MLQAIGLLEVIGILRVHDLEQNLLHVRLISLILNDLTELNSIDFCGNKPLYLIEKVLLLR